MKPAHQKRFFAKAFCQARFAAAKAKSRALRDRGPWPGNGAGSHTNGSRRLPTAWAAPTCLGPSDSARTVSLAGLNAGLSAGGRP
jgi:hypothetical protein